jgi:hypothetical protein
VPVSHVELPYLEKQSYVASAFVASVAEPPYICMRLRVFKICFMSGGSPLLFLLNLRWKFSKTKFHR